MITAGGQPITLVDNGPPGMDPEEGWKMVLEMQKVKLIYQDLSGAVFHVIKH
jgi:hypothetical protein